MKKGKEPAEYISDDEPTTDHSEEKVELNNEEMMNAPEEKAISDAIKLAESQAVEASEEHRSSNKNVLTLKTFSESRVEPPMMLGTQTSGLSHQPGWPHNAAHHSYGMLDTDTVIISDWINEFYMPASADSMTREEFEKLSVVDDFDQDVPAPQQSADNSVLGSEMPSTAQLQEGTSSTDVEKVTSDAGQQIE